MYFWVYVFVGEAPLWLNDAPLLGYPIKVVIKMPAVNRVFENRPAPPELLALEAKIVDSNGLTFVTSEVFASEQEANEWRVTPLHGQLFESCNNCVLYFLAPG